MVTEAFLIADQSVMVAEEGVGPLIRDFYRMQEERVHSYKLLEEYVWKSIVSRLVLGML